MVNTVFQFLGYIATALTIIFGIVKLKVKLFEGKKKLKIQVSQGFLGGEESLGRYVLVVSAANIGDRPVGLQSAGFDLPSGEKVPIMRSDLPARIKPGDPEHIEFLYIEPLLNAMESKNLDAPTYGWFKDAEGKKHKAKVNKGIRKDIQGFIS